MIFVELNENQLLEIDGGIAASAVFAIAGGACYLVSGIASLCGSRQVAGWASIAGGTCEVAAGVCLLLP